jgi:predicted transcriptional regulator
MRDEMMSTSDSDPATTVTIATELTARIVAAYLSNNGAAIVDLPKIIRSVHLAL